MTESIMCLMDSIENIRSIFNKMKGIRWSFILVAILCAIAICRFVKMFRTSTQNIEHFSNDKTSISFLSRFSARLSVFANPLISATPYGMVGYSSLVGNMSIPSPLMAMIGSFSPLESMFRTGLSGKTNVSQVAAVYSKNVLDFSAAEQNSIKNLILSTTALSDNRWSFVKKADVLDGGESMILGDYICLSQKDTAIITSEEGRDDDDDETDNRLMLLISMLIYKIIKKDPKKYEKFYVQQGFTFIPRLDVPADLAKVRYSDPNVPKGEWSASLDGINYWSTRVIRDNAIKTETYVVIKTGDTYAVTMPSIDSKVVREGLGVDDTDKIHHPACLLTLNPMILHADNPQTSDDQTDDEPITI